MSFAAADENGICTEKKGHSNGEKMAALLERKVPLLGRIFEAIARLARENELAARERAAIISVLQKLSANTETTLQTLQQQLPPAMNPSTTEVRGDSSSRMIATTFAGEGAYWSIGRGESNDDSVKTQALRSCFAYYERALCLYAVKRVVWRTTGSWARRVAQVRCCGLRRSSLLMTDPTFSICLGKA